MIKTGVKKPSPTEKARANAIKFYEILNDLPSDFSLGLNNVSKEFNGTWKKTVVNGLTAWQNETKILFNASLYPVRKEVFQAIEKEGYPLRNEIFSDMKRKVDSPLTKEKLKELYCKQKKSLQDIGKEYGCSRQWVSLLMEKYGVKRRTRSKARIIAIRQNKILFIRPRR